MAYTWDWKRKSGELYFNNYKYTFYEGNGFMIVLDEYKEKQDNGDLIDKYRVAWFFVDKPHAKRSLGLVKGSYDMFEGNVEKLVIFKDNCSYWKDIVDLFTKSQPNIVIEIRPKEEVVA